ncbi:MAG: sodium:solute symporter family protein [Candidatus Methanomethylophilus sp.]|nr:sodium:solute symporter family protein [Methanomethylophilus sp.]
MAEGVSIPIFVAMLVIFAAVTIFLGLYGYKNTKNNSEFLLGRNKTNPLIIGLSYGATFLSASAVIGFGGQAATHGLTVMWLCFLNLFVGLFIAFLVFGPRTRKIGRKLGASTFSDLLGKMYKSKGIRGYTALLIIIMMPIYCAAVLKGGVNSVAVLTGLTEYYDAILIILAVIVGVYVVYGGIIAVMYNDALQAAIMFVGMLVILIVTFSAVGGVTEGFTSLSEIDTGIAGGVLPGFNGWTEVAEFGSNEWMLVVTTFLMGVGLGVLTQPQLIVRFMSAKDDKMLNRSLIVGSIFMFLIVGSAYTSGALSNVFFMDKHGLPANNYVSGLGLGTDFIVPQYILEVFDGIFGGDFFICLFLLSLVCASISTISALMHTIGAAGGYDLYTIMENHKAKRDKDSQSVRINRIVTAIMMILVVLYCYWMPKEIIAKATSLFMGITAAALLPAFCHGLYTKGTPDKNAAIASITVGTVVYMVWALFINSSMSVFMPVCKWITGNAVLFPNTWMAFCDPLVIALPLSIVVFVVMRLIAKQSGKTAEAPASN